MSGLEPEALLLAWCFSYMYSSQTSQNYILLKICIKKSYTTIIIAFLCLPGRMGAYLTPGGRIWLPELWKGLGLIPILYLQYGGSTVVNHFVRTCTLSATRSTMCWNHFKCDHVTMYLAWHPTFLSPPLPWRFLTLQDDMNHDLLVSFVSWASWAFCSEITTAAYSYSEILFIYTSLFTTSINCRIGKVAIKIYWLIDIDIERRRRHKKERQTPVLKVNTVSSHFLYPPPPYCNCVVLS
jgi:hypothetical protein